MKVNDLIEFVRSIYADEPFIPLHRPVFGGREVGEVEACITSNFVSSVGGKVNEFEQRVAKFVGARFGVATVNGTSALQVALRLVGVQVGDEVITQPLTFVATCNAVAYLGARPVFVDVERGSLCLDPDALIIFLRKTAERRNGACYNKLSGRRIAACQVMHTFGHPARVDRLAEICSDWGIPFVEDAAESLGSYYKDKHSGTYGKAGVFSFNGNKIITTGGGGMIVTDDESLATRAKHLTTTAKEPHDYEYVHSELGYNFRMPNLNAALGCAQMDQLPQFIKAKRTLAQRYAAFCKEHKFTYLLEPHGARSNYWLNAIVLNSKRERDQFLQQTNAAGVMTRPIWKLMIDLPMYAQCHHDGLFNSRWLEERVICLPSSVP